ncbi:hypothetical protein LCGC14_3132700, partial [marine sediment metagenome]
VKEFRELGFIQEINRRILHPCGLAIEVIVDKDTGEETLGGIWDYRDDPEGLRFAESQISLDETSDKVRSVDQLLKSKEQSRLDNLGYIVQPVEE